MSPLDFSSAKRLCLWTLAWSGLPALAGAEILLVGTPTIPTLTSTLTLTTTVEYRPSLIPGNSQYTLVGCYSPFSEDGGHIFGPGDHDAVSEDKIKPSDLTIETCLRGFGSLVPPKEEEKGYTYVGLRNGSECRCSNQLPADTHKLPNDNCMAPCPGDPKLSCGGRTNITVYSLILTPSETKHSTTTPTTTSSSTASSSTTDTEATAPSEPFPSSVAPGKPASAATVGAITGSLSGAVLIVACLFLCYRAHTRKKRVQDAHVKSVLDRRGQRPVQSPIFTQADIHNQVGHLVAPGGINGKDGGQHSSGRNKSNAYGNLVPNTPALELGEKPKLKSTLT
ncbi:hypothetical protein NPX13_g6470 [Xylaria arbuscula]|uniref:WSC domain-containing protein n=1 Tax=Xylaria arbuscula TaxID=114810 RepID=A0A9W8NCF2_9PEZI|nr:hypothetical protein NPX13_g6470 [Xylaria arbuscula]